MMTASEEETLDILAGSVSIQSAINFLRRAKEQKEALAEKEKELEALAEKDKEQNEVIKKLTEEKASNEILDETWMGYTYGCTKEDFKQPPIKLNTDVKPSVSGNTRKRKIKDRDGKIMMVQMKIPSVKIQYNCDEMWVDPDDQGCA